MHRKEQNSIREVKLLSCSTERGHSILSNFSSLVFPTLACSFLLLPSGPSLARLPVLPEASQRHPADADVFLTTPSASSIVRIDGSAAQQAHNTHEEKQWSKLEWNFPFKLLGFSLSVLGDYSAQAFGPLFAFHNGAFY